MSQDPKSKLKSDGFDFTPTIHSDTYDFIDPGQFDLNGRSIFITGASKGIGYNAALSFAKAGASYIGLAARSSMSNLEEKIQSAAQAAGRASPRVLMLKVDVTSEESVQAAAKEMESACGHVDILLNNAGYLEPFVPLTESRIEDWWKTWEANVKGVYLVTRAFLPLLLKSDLKTILNTSSIGAHKVSHGASGYQTTKLAVLRFTEFINAEYSGQGMLAFSFHPGGVATELALGMPKATHGVLIDTVELAADSIVWLTAERRDWLAGRYVSVTWDMNELVGKREKIVNGDLLKVRMDVGSN